MILHSKKEVYGLALFKKLSSFSDYAEQYEIEKYLVVETSAGLLLDRLILNPLLRNQTKRIIRVSSLLYDRRD